MKKQIVRVAFFLLLSFVLSLQVFAATEFEPNDTIETATPVEMEEEVFAELSAQDPADTDFYEFTVTKAGVITLTLDYDGTAAEDALSYYRVHIYNLASEYPVRTLTIVPGDPLQPKTVARFGPGTYYMEVNHDDAVLDDASPYHFTMHYIDGDQPHDHITTYEVDEYGVAHHTCLACGATFEQDIKNDLILDRAIMGYPYDIFYNYIGYFRFVPKESGNYLFYTEETDARNATLYSSDWTELVQAKNMDHGFRLSCHLTKGNTYYLKASYADYRYSYPMTVAVTQTACGGADSCAGKRFGDAPQPGNWAHDAIDWAIDSAITNGTSATAFSPEMSCTRAQVVTFLWRAAGSPEPESLDHPFTDVAAGSYYHKAVLWAVEQGITNGTASNKFSPDMVCSRGQIVTFLWRYEGAPALKNAANPFKDVVSGAYYEKAVLWASKNGITSGTTPTTFRPDDTCTRAQVVTFLHRDVMVNAAKVNDAELHSYEFVISNCTWREAYEIAAKKGGYLVNFNSREEYDAVLAQLEEQGYHDVYFRLGGNRVAEEYFWNDHTWWDDDDTVLNSPDVWCADLWLPGEPNFEWDGVEEGYLEMYYSAADGRWVWCDVKNEMTYPADPERCGYIIEYNWQ